MKILIAEDDLISRTMLQATLTEWSYDVVAVGSGTEALKALEEDATPMLAVLDWMMPGMDGVEVCRRVRAKALPEPPYLILLTGRGDKGDIVAGLGSGANDYIAKPYDRGELQARIQVGCRVMELQRILAARVRELEEALSQIKHLQGLLPLCCYCKKVRDDHNYWQQVEDYLNVHAGVQVSHGVCPECWDRVIHPQLKEWGGSGLNYPSRD